VQAIGAAGLTSASLGLVVASSAPEQRARSVEIWTATGAVAAALGPVLGGLLVEASWRWIFLLNVPIGLLAMLAAIRWVPDSRDASVTRFPDLLGAALLAAGIGLLSLALVEGPEWGWDGPRTDIAWAAAVAGLAGFAAQSSRHSSPVVAPALLRVRTFVWSSLTVLVFAIPFGASLLAAVLWLQQMWGYSPLRTGLAITPAPLLVMVFAAVGHRLASRFPIGLVVSLGCLASSAGMALIAASAGAGSVYATEFLPGWMIGGAGIGLALPALVSVATSDLPSADASTGSGVVNMNRQIGTALGVSLVVAVLGTSTTYPVTHAAFRHAWFVIAALAALTAAVAARLPSPHAARPVEAAGAQRPARGRAG
jgi:MFS family permease